MSLEELAEQVSEFRARISGDRPYPPDIALDRLAALLVRVVAHQQQLEERIERESQRIELGWRAQR